MISYTPDPPPPEPNPMGDEEGDTCPRDAIRLCPACMAHGNIVALQPAGKHAWLCPNQRDAGNGISQERRPRPPQRRASQE